MNQPRHTYEWVMSHTWMSHVTHMNESRHAYERDTLHIWRNHVIRTNGSVAIATETMAIAKAIRALAIATDPFVRVTWFVHMCDGKSHVQVPLCRNAHSSCTSSTILSVQWMNHVTYVNQPCHAYEKFTWNTWTNLVTHTNGTVAIAKAQEYAQQLYEQYTRERAVNESEAELTIESSAKSQRFVNQRLSLPWVSHVTDMNGLCHTYEWIMSHIRMSHVTPMHELCHMYWVVELPKVSLATSLGLFDMGCL